MRRREGEKSFISEGILQLIQVGLGAGDGGVKSIGHCGGGDGEGRDMCGAEKVSI